MRNFRFGAYHILANPGVCQVSCANAQFPIWSLSYFGQQVKRQFEIIWYGALETFRLTGGQS